MSYKIIPVSNLSESFFNDLFLFIDLSEETLDKIASCLEQEEGFDLFSKEEYIKLITENDDLKAKQITTVSAIIEFLYTRLFKTNSNVEELVDELEKLSNEFDHGSILNKKEQFDKIFEQKPAFDKKKLMNAELHSGNRLISKSASTIDIRPVFDQDGDEILDYVILGTITFVTESALNKEKSTTFHVELDDLDNLIEDLQGLREKINLSRKKLAN